MSSLNTCVTAGTRRLDPQTGMPFVRGACREDGYRFVTYQKTVVRKDDTFKELWLRPDRFDSHLSAISKAGIRWSQANRKRYGAIIARYKMWKGCKLCGYKGHPSALDLDHRDRSLKSFNISGALGGGQTWAKIKEEVRKCDVLCANCRHIKTVEGEEWRIP